MPELPEGTSVSARHGLGGAVRLDQIMVWVALFGLVIACAIFEPSTLSGSAVLSMLPFAAILAIAAVGQCLTIQQGGLDLSVAGSMSLAAAIVTGHASGHDDRLAAAIMMALVAVLIGGFLNGIAISKLRITPIIATLAVNALLVGTVQSYTNSAPKQATANLSHFAVEKTLGIPNTVIVAAVFVIVIALVISKTVVGRRMVAIGANPSGARAAGLRVSRYVIGTYVAAAFCFGVAGIVLAGYLRTPGPEVGNPYLFSSITAVIVGGTAFGGGRGRIIGTAIAAIFLSQLEAFLTATGAPFSVVLLVQAGAIAIAATLSNREAAVRIRHLVRRALRSRPMSQPEASGV
jgi:ribose transport system permease protein